MRFPTACAIGLMVLGAATAWAAEDRVLELPADYQTAFDNYMISDRLGQEDQVISLFANEVARSGPLQDGRLPEGSVLIGELYKVKLDGDGAPLLSPLNRRIPDKLAAIVVMEKRAEWAGQYPDDLKLDGWEFEVFSPTGENLAKDTTACRECHAPLGETDYLWSIAHIRAAN
ncbi:MAG: cytochrome P460 family protein [Pseudomonadota bacterium]